MTKEKKNASPRAGATVVALVGTGVEHLVDQPERLRLVGLEELIAVHLAAAFGEKRTHG